MRQPGRVEGRGGTNCFSNILKTVNIPFIPGNVPRGDRNQIVNGFTVEVLVVSLAGCGMCAVACICVLNQLQNNNCQTKGV